jgi:hypothetical protein
VGVGLGVIVLLNEFEAVKACVPDRRGVGSIGKSSVQLNTFRAGACPGRTSKDSASLRSKHSGRKYLNVALLVD